MLSRHAKSGEPELTVVNEDLRDKHNAEVLKEALNEFIDVMREKNRGKE